MPNPFFLPSRSVGEAVSIIFEAVCIAAFIAGVWAVALVLRGA